MRLTNIVAPVASVALIAACGSTQATPSGETLTSTLSFQTTLPGENFTGNSVRICGSRTPPADAKYRCSNNFNAALGVPLASGDKANDTGAGGNTIDEDCPCFQFNPDGTLASFFRQTSPAPGDKPKPLPTVDGSPGGQVPNLCPTQDLGAGAAGQGPWTFDYQIFTDAFCGGDGGTLLNGPNNPNNFVCFAPKDLEIRAYPNTTVDETLNPGENANAVICTTVNASKGFDFTSCAQTCAVPSSDGGFQLQVGPSRPGPDGIFNCDGTTTPPQSNAYQCGCTAVNNNGCDCGGGISGTLGMGIVDPNTGMPIGCTFENLESANLPIAVECAIVCPLPAPPGGEP